MTEPTQNTTSTDNKPAGKSGWWRFALFGIPATTVAVLFTAGIVFWGGFNTAMEATNTLPFCISCHEMKDNVYQEYKTTIHYQNRTGVRATCSDCHVPDPWIHKMVRKVQASSELVHKVLGSVDTPEKFDAKRLALAKKVWNTMKATDSRECRNCHNFQSMAPEFQRPRARTQHLNALKNGQTCIDCHKGIAHKDVRNLLDEEELEELEKPNPDFARVVPASYVESLQRVVEREEKDATVKEEKRKAAEVQVKQRVESAVASAVAAERAKAAAAAEATKAETSTAAQSENTQTQTAAATSSTSSSAGPDIDWNGVEAKTVTLFYPGQASFEWVQTGKDHGGARAFAKLGDLC